MSHQETFKNSQMAKQLKCSSVEYVNLHKVASFMATFDMYKAYDRVMLSYLTKVMVAMNFPCKSIDWILMLHDGATTRFILNFLTDPIKVVFSIRQGDPLSMLLYIIGFGSCIGSAKR